MTKKILVEAGDRFGRLKVVHEAQQSEGKHRKFSCLCDCGNVSIVLLHSLRSGETRSCGCWARESAVNRATKHGCCIAGKQTPEYNIWTSMIARCERPKNIGYQHYGGRGITVCPRWRSSFEAFLEDMGEKSFHNASIDRIDSNGNYNPKNCRWASPKEQGRNRSNNRMLTFDDKTQCVSEWEEDAGFPRGLFRSRLRLGWDIKKILTTPVKQSKRVAKEQ